MCGGPRASHMQSMVQFEWIWPRLVKKHGLAEPTTSRSQLFKLYSTSNPFSVEYSCQMVFPKPFSEGLFIWNCRGGADKTHRRKNDVIRGDEWAICTGLRPYLQEMFPQVPRWFPEAPGVDIRWFNEKIMEIGANKIEQFKIDRDPRGSIGHRKGSTKHGFNTPKECM